MKKFIARSAEAQRRDGGDRYIGRKLPAYLKAAGYNAVETRIKTISSFDIDLDQFLKIVLDFRTERLSPEETDAARKELEDVYAAVRQAYTWGSLGIFVATGRVVE